jgi:ribosomal-protein-alanine N-acetyltransferase
VLTAIEIRRLRLSDLAAIERVERRAYPTPWSRTMFAGEIAKPTSLCFGGFAGDALAGYIIVSRHVDAWHVMNVAVDEPFRQQGLAQRMLENVFRETAGDGTRGYTLEVRVSNHGAIRLYERLGFQPTGIRRGYYTDNREDALIMWRDAAGAAAAADDDAPA